MDAAGVSRPVYIVMPSSQDGGDYYFATWTGISGDRFYRNGAGADSRTVTNAWLDENIRSKGPLGKVYPKFLIIMEGTRHRFGADRQRPQRLPAAGLGGWGGRYVFRQPSGETHPIWTQGGDEFWRTTSQDTVAEWMGLNTPPTRRRSGVGAKPIKMTLQPA